VFDEERGKKIPDYAVAARDTAIEKLGRPIFANIAMLRAMGKKIEVLDKANVLSTIPSIIPKFKKENENAIEIGYNLISLISH